MFSFCVNIQESLCQNFYMYKICSPSISLVFPSYSHTFFIAALTSFSSLLLSNLFFNYCSKPTYFKQNGRFSLCLATGTAAPINWGSRKFGRVAFSMPCFQKNLSNFSNTPISWLFFFHRLLKPPRSSVPFSQTAMVYFPLWGPSAWVCVCVIAPRNWNKLSTFFCRNFPMTASAYLTSMVTSFVLLIKTFFGHINRKSII